MTICQLIHVAQAPTAPDFVQNPYPFYDRARAIGPLVWWEEYGLACATTHEAVGAFLKDRRLGREIPSEMVTESPPHLKPFWDFESRSMLELEPPAHTRLRGLVLRAFTSRRIAELAPEVSALCDQLIDRFPAGEFDLLDAYARPIPVIIIARLLGVPESMADQLLAWSNAMVSMYQARKTREIEDAAVRATVEFSGFIRDYVTEKRKKPADDLISELIAAEQKGEKLSTDELITTCILLLNAGHEATVHTIGNGVKVLLETGILPNPDTAEGVAEEVMRYDPPLHMFTRYAYEEIEFYGHTFQRGDQVACLLGAAGRDPVVYEDPHEFDPHRTRVLHHAFGAGIHFCVGAPLARLELATAFERLFARKPGLTLGAAPTYANVYHFHGLERLMVRA